MTITCYSKNRKSYSWCVRKKDALRAGVKFEFKFFSLTFDGDVHVLGFHKDHHDGRHRLHKNKGGKAGPAFTCNEMVEILEPGERKTVYDLEFGAGNSNMVYFFLGPETGTKRLEAKRVAPQLHTQLKVEPAVRQLDTDRLVSFITEAQDNSIELLNLIENENQTKKTRAIAGIYRAEIEEAESLINHLLRADEKLNQKIES